ncbi:hypothetical protein CASFOL_030537 [Castilleja foliolosa]|uniref:Uncharacterized protein n=1 Tax=Castilleja foliolosa TaxID=1961234 RepID=A0ABD3CA41_9LAMI
MDFHTLDRRDLQDLERVDVTSGPVWMEYIAYLKSLPAKGLLAEYQPKYNSARAVYWGARSMLMKLIGICLLFLLPVLRRGNAVDDLENATTRELTMLLQTNELHSLTSSVSCICIITLVYGMTMTRGMQKVVSETRQSEFPAGFEGSSPIPGPLHGFEDEKFGYAAVRRGTRPSRNEIVSSSDHIVSERGNFDLSMPLHLTTVDWYNFIKKLALYYGL